MRKLRPGLPLKRGVTVFLLIVVSLSFCFSAFADEADWVYQAAAFIDRFGKIASSDASPLNRQAAYLELLDDCAQFSAMPAESERSGRARQLIYLMMHRRITEQLGNAAVMTRSTEAYARARVALPRDEKILLAFLDPTDGEYTSLAPRTCTVEARGQEVQVTAVGYPIVELLTRMASATGKKVNIPSEVSGLVDIDIKGWTRIDAALVLFVGGRGLFVKPNMKDRIDIIVRDSLYMASLCERSREQPRMPVVKPVKNGIKTGYVIARGRYLAPPYQVEVRKEKAAYAVCINGVKVGNSYGFASRPAAPPIANGNPVFTLKNKLILSAYVNESYAALLKTSGHAIAIERVGRILDAQKVVKSWRLDAERNELWITFVDGGEVSAMLPWPKAAGKTPEQPKDDEARQHAAMVAATAAKVAIAETLAENGLVLCPSNGPIHKYGEKEARQKLLIICGALQETIRQEEQLYDGVFDSWREEAPAWAWEIFLTLRHRELLLRLQAEELP